MLSLNLKLTSSLSLISIFNILLNISLVSAQIKIGLNGTKISPSSLLELESQSQGLLLSRIDDTTTINLLKPPNGMLIFLTKEPSVGLYVRKTAGWEYLTGSFGGNGVFNSLTVPGKIIAGNFTGPLSGNATSATIATNSTNSVITDDQLTKNVTYPVFVTTSIGNTGLRTSSNNLKFVPETGILTAKGFSGPLTGNVNGTSSMAIDAVNSSNSDITNDISTNASYYLTFVSGIEGNLPLRTSSTKLSFNPSSGQFNANRISGFWNGGVILGEHGGTGVANTGRTINLEGNLRTFGTNDIVLRSLGSTDITLPQSGTLVSALSRAVKLNFPLTIKGKSSDQNVFIAGVVDGDVVALGVPSSLIVAGVSFFSWISAPDTVSVRFINNSDVDLDPLSNTFNIKILK